MKEALQVMKVGNTYYEDVGLPNEKKRDPIILSCHFNSDYCFNFIHEQSPMRQKTEIIFKNAKLIRWLYMHHK